MHILHATKPLLLGLNFAEYRTITISAAFVSILGPLIAGPWADRLAARNPNGFGRTLRRLTAVFLLLTALIYALLFFVPEVAREPAKEPDVNFGCDANGAFIFQKLCSNGTCHNWEHKKGSVKLTHCTYSCLNPNYHENMYQFWLGELPTAAPSTEQSSEFDYDQDDQASATTEKYRPRRDVNIADLAADSAGVEQLSSEVLRVKRQVKNTPKKVYVEPPHLCITERNEQGENVVKNCHVYTQDTPNIVVQADMGAAMTEPKTNETAGWCQYPLGELERNKERKGLELKLFFISKSLTTFASFSEGIQCNIPPQQVKYMKDLTNGTECKPIIECMIVDAYDGEDSVLADSECITVRVLPERLKQHKLINLLFTDNWQCGRYSN